jgi:hypothetical protein
LAGSYDFQVSELEVYQVVKVWWFKFY